VTLRPEERTDATADGWGGFSSRYQGRVDAQFLDIGHAIAPFFFESPESCVIKASKIHHYAQDAVSFDSGVEPALRVESTMFLRGDGIGGGAGLFGIRGTNTVSVRVLNCDFYDFDHVGAAWAAPTEPGGAIALLAPNKSYGGGGPQDTVIVSGNRMVGPGEDYGDATRNALDLYWISGGSNRYVELNDNAAIRWGTGVKLTECRDFGLKCNRLQDNRTGVDWGRNPSVDPEVALRENLIESSFEEGVLTASDIGKLALGSLGTLPADRGHNRLVIDNDQFWYASQNASADSLAAQQNQWFDTAAAELDSFEVDVLERVRGNDPGRVNADSVYLDPISPCWPDTVSMEPPGGGQALGNLVATGPQSAVQPDEDGAQAQPSAPSDEAVGVGMSIPEVATGIAAVRPNPFRGRVEIVLGVARREGLEGRVTIYDVAGRRVRSLHSGMISAGHTTIGWDGRDEHGVAAVAGVYFVRVRLGGQEYLRKFVKVH
jgi:hypothetical protein